jgi:hypothetical protein
MSQELSLEGKKPKDTFQRLLQISGTTLYDGVGNEIPTTGFTTTVYVNTGDTINEITNVFSGASDNVTILTAGEVIGGGRTVYVNDDGLLYIYRNTDMDAFGKFIGITKGAVNMNEQVQVQMMGVHTDVGFGYVSGETYYVSDTGLPTTVIPLSGFLHVLGVGLTPNTLRIIDNNLEIELL